MIRRHFQLRETIVTIIAARESEIEAAISAIRHHRQELESFIIKDPFFMTTLEPYCVEIDDPPLIVEKMVEASRKVGCGPMAAVAGTIAELARAAMIEEGASYAVVDNGGDIALTADRVIKVGIYAGGSVIRDLAFEIEPTPLLGICTSSATVGPSISFGVADVACVVSRDVSLADAAATVLGNAVRLECDIEEAFSVVKDISGIDGALIIHQDRLALWGKLPVLVRADVDPELITCGREYVNV
ncbi:MAG: UPF0280 family protein [Candidatus Syntropharchaeales archaeon]